MVFLEEIVDCVNSVFFLLNFNIFLGINKKKLEIIGIEVKYIF